MSDSTSEGVRVGVSLTLRELTEEAETTLHLGLGGPLPVIAIGCFLSTDDKGEFINMKVDATGWDTISELANYLRSLARHLEATPGHIVTADGVETMPPIKPLEPGEAI